MIFETLFISPEHPRAHRDRHGCHSWYHRVGFSFLPTQRAKRLVMSCRFRQILDCVLCASCFLSPYLFVASVTIHDPCPAARPPIWPRINRVRLFAQADDETRGVAGRIIASAARRSGVRLSGSSFRLFVFSRHDQEGNAARHSCSFLTSPWALPHCLATWVAHLRLRSAWQPDRQEIILHLVR